MEQPKKNCITIKKKQTKGQWVIDKWNTSISSKLNKIKIAILGECPERIANAKLIASAPELLENLIKLRNEFNSFDGLGQYQQELITNATNAIKKATEQ